MALTYANLHRRSIGGDYLLVETLTPAASDYATGGYLLSFPEFSDGVIKAVWQAGINQTVVTAAYHVQFNYTTGKLQMFWSNSSATTLPEITNGTDLSAAVFVVCAIGK